MEKFTSSIKFVMAFLFVLVLLSMFAGQKFTYMFLVLVLFGMVILNTDKFNTILGGLKYE